MIGPALARPDWQRDAACHPKNHDDTMSNVVEAAFAAPGDREAAKTFARTFCEGCPVSGECLDFAVENRIEYGVWGGILTHRSRQVAHIQRHDR